MSGGKGDALLFPVFNGTMDSHFAILNDSDYWIQGHLRFRGAGWSGELLDLDVILSPHDVLEFRIADVDGDGFWELDQSLDPKNFEYTGMLKDCKSKVTQEVFSNCMDPLDLLIPPVGGSVTQESIDYHFRWGYVEFIGEGVLGEEVYNEATGNWDTIFGMNHGTMNALIDPTNEGKLANLGQRRIGEKKLGTHLWSWTDADGARGGDDKNAAVGDVNKLDVPNMLSGTAFITLPEYSHGLSYNAEAIQDFRTAVNFHRIDNYPPTRAVIIHDENAGGKTYGASPAGDYLYGFPFNPAGAGPGDDRQDEARLSFNTTWGPTLADGDDYDPIPTMEGSPRPVNGAGQDDWDLKLTHANPAVKGPDNLNSIAEVEEAIRLTGQRFTGFYLDDIDNQIDGQGGLIPSGLLKQLGIECTQVGVDCTSLMSIYYTFFPTKYFYGESAALAPNFNTYLNQAVNTLLGLIKETNFQLRDAKEECPCEPDNKVTPCEHSPCQPDYKEWPAPCTFRFKWQHEGQLSNILEFKRLIYCPAEPNPNWKPSKGKLSIWPADGTMWPMLIYTFDLEANNPSAGSSFIHHWKSMTH
jgi:hypothetical protein